MKKQQKEEVTEPELKVGSVILVEQAWEDIRGEYHDEYAKVLSIDNLGFMKLEFEKEEINKFLKDCEYRFEEYKHCVVNEILFKSKSTSSDTFIEMKIEEFHRKYDFSENETLEYDNLIGIAGFLKSSLQEQRQSILEEIEKLPKVQYGVYGSGDLLRDIKQLLK